MKSYLTPIVYPTSKEEEFKWGFDVFKPQGTPMAWVIDWESGSAGYGLPWERVKEVAQFKVSEDLSKLTVDEIFAAHTYMFKLQWHSIFKTIENRYGVKEARQIARDLGYPMGKRGWTLLMERFGSPVPLDKAAWYQDIAHLLYGPDTHAYSWTDGEKSVCARTRCLFHQPEEMESNSVYPRSFCDAYIEAYMDVEPGLFCVRSPHYCLDPDVQGEDDGKRCVHIWTYEKSIIDAMPEKWKAAIPPTTKEVLRKKGAKV
jgi:hypothetical protein